MNTIVTPEPIYFNDRKYNVDELKNILLVADWGEVPYIIKKIDERINPQVFLNSDLDDIVKNLNTQKGVDPKIWFHLVREKGMICFFIKALHFYISQPKLSVSFIYNLINNGWNQHEKKAIEQMLKPSLYPLFKKTILKFLFNQKYLTQNFFYQEYYLNQNKNASFNGITIFNEAINQLLIDDEKFFSFFHNETNHYDEPTSDLTTNQISSYQRHILQNYYTRMIKKINILNSYFTNQQSIHINEVVILHQFIQNRTCHIVPLHIFFHKEALKIINTFVWHLENQILKTNSSNMIMKVKTL